MIAWLWVEREETVSRYEDGTVKSAAFHVNYELLNFTRFGRIDKGSFSAGWQPGLPGPDIVSLTSPSCGSGYVVLELPDLKGQRIGTYLMNEVVGWVKQWPDAMVSPVRLLTVQAHGDNKERRNKFYERFNLVFDYEDEGTQEAGISRPMPASELVQADAWRKNIEEMDARGLMREFLHENDCLRSDLKWARQDSSHQSELIAFTRRHPIRFAMAQLWHNGITWLRR